MNSALVIVGCTASGKSDLAEGIADSTGAALIATDALQVYRGMDIGTAKPDAATREKYRYHMIDVADAWESYSAARYAAEARPLVEQRLTKGAPVVVVAGTVLYLRALVEGLFEGPAADAATREAIEAEAAEKGIHAVHDRLVEVDPLAGSRIHPNDLRRIVRALEVWTLTGKRISDLQTQWNAEHPPVPTVWVGIRREKEELNRRINARVKKMFEAGLVDEVRRLSADPRGISQQASDGVGYRQLLDHFAGKLTLEDAVEQIKISTRHLAKMQRTWFKRFPKVMWIDIAHSADPVGKAIDIWRQSVL